MNKIILMVFLGVVLVIYSSLGLAKIAINSGYMDYRVPALLSNGAAQNSGDCQTLVFSRNSVTQGVVKFPAAIDAGFQWQFKFSARPQLAYPAFIKFLTPTGNGCPKVRSGCIAYFSADPVHPDRINVSVSPIGKATCSFAGKPNQLGNIWTITVSSTLE